MLDDCLLTRTVVGGTRRPLTVAALSHIDPTSGRSASNPVRPPVETSALHRHAAAGRLEEMQAELRKPAVDPDDWDGDGTSALHLACAEGHHPCVVALLEAGADVNREDRAGWMALHNAIVEGDEAIVETLLEAGADTSMKVEIDGYRCDAVRMAELQEEDAIAEQVRQASSRSSTPFGGRR